MLIVQMGKSGCVYRRWFPFGVCENELKGAARTNSKARRERTQTRGANELKGAARTNSGHKKEPDPSIRRTRIRIESDS